MRTVRSARLAGDTNSLKKHREERNFFFKPNLCLFLYKNKQLLLMQVVFILMLDPPYSRPCLDVRQIPLGIPTFLPMEGVHSQNQKTMSSLHSFTESLFPFMIGTFTAHQNRFR